MVSVKHVVKRATPVFALRAYRSVRGRWNQDDLLLDAKAVPGPMVTEVFEPIRSLPGFFTYDDCAAFTLVLGQQHASGLVGDVLEIGCYHGRSTTVLARQLRDGERLVVCDLFDYSDLALDDPPTPERVRAIVRAAAPGLADDRVEIIAGDSTTLTFPPGQRFRFIHIDGGHTYDVVRADLSLAAAHLMPGGMIVLDDYENHLWPDVTRAGDDFLADRPDAEVVADVNRYGHPGRKLYLTLGTDGRGHEDAVGAAGREPPTPSL